MNDKSSNTDNIPDADSIQNPGLFRRLAAITYDVFLLLAVLFIATLIVLPFSPEDTITPSHPFFQVYLFLVSYLFFGWFWTHGGQTLGLIAWKSKVLDNEGNTLTWAQAFARFCWAILSWSAFGLGFIWILFDKNNLAWHDKLSKTRLYSIEKQDTKTSE